MNTVMKTTINAPPHLVFPWLEDDERLKKWVPNIIEDEALIETPEKVGSTFRQVFEERGKEMEMTGEITAYVENERIRVFMTGDMFNLDVDYLLDAERPDQTVLTQDTTIKFKGMMILLTPLFGLLSKFSSNDPQKDAHAKLKELVEAEFNAQS